MKYKEPKAWIEYTFLLVTVSASIFREEQLKSLFATNWQEEMMTRQNEVGVVVNGKRTEKL